MLRDSAATEKVNEQVPSNDGNCAHGDAVPSSSALSVSPGLGVNVGSVVKQDLTSLPISDLT